MIKTIKNKKIEFVILVVLALIISAVAEFVCMLLVSHFDSLFHGFNFARYFFFLGACLVLITIFYIYKEKIKQVETIFLVLSIIIGSVMILSSPFGHISWDLESHFSSLMSYASFDNHVTGAEQFICDDGAGSIYKNGYENNQNFIQETNDKDSIEVNKSYHSFIISHIPGAIVYDASKIVGLPFNVRLDLVRFCYLILYSIICYFAIKKLKTSKLIFATIGLFPTCLFIASNITYDWWIISFCMLGIAYFYSEYQQPKKKLKTTELLIMMGSLFLGCYIKSIYFLLLFVPLFMKKEYFKNNKKEVFKYYLIVVFFILLLFGMFLLSFFGIGSVGDNRGGGNVNPAEQLSFILTNPLKYTFILVNFFTNYMSIANLINLTSSFAHLTATGRLPIARDFGFFIILLVVVTAVDRNNYDRLTTTWKFKILSFIAFFVSSILIITALYIDFNNVGSKTIGGVQARYLIPLLPMLLPTLGFVNKAHDARWPGKNIKVGFATFVSIFMFWDIAHVMLLRLI